LLPQFLIITPITKKCYPVVIFSETREEGVKYPYPLGSDQLTCFLQGVETLIDTLMLKEFLVVAHFDDPSLI